MRVRDCGVRPFARRMLRGRQGAGQFRAPRKRNLKMQKLGYTRSASRRDHFLLTPDTFVRAPLPGMMRATAVVHAAPAHGAGFTEYTVEFEAGGSCEDGRASGVPVCARRRL